MSEPPPAGAVPALVAGPVRPRCAVVERCDLDDPGLGDPDGGRVLVGARLMVCRGMEHAMGEEASLCGIPRDRLVALHRLWDRSGLAACPACQAAVARS